MLDKPETTVSVAFRDWNKLLAPYRSSDLNRSIFEIAVTAIPFIALWATSYFAWTISFWLMVPFALITSGFVVRLFLIQHDCGHGSFFQKAANNDWVGRVLGVITMTPYQVWRYSHAKHHATSGHLDKRGFGDIDTLTVREYRAMSKWEKIGYRIYRFPLVMFVIGPLFVFVLKQRLPFGLMRSGAKFWVSAMGTNIAIAATFAAMIWLVGWKAFLAVHLSVIMMTCTIGVWLFYVQHQFEDSYWADSTDWTAEEAALYGSSHYDLPGPLRWITANIGIHHVHHLYSRIPYYKLPQVLRDFPELADIRRFGFIESLSCIKLRFWDEAEKRMVSLKEASMAPAPAR
ncbi:MAG: fatty acid desaturase [Beijerinckiaceae bacterium]